MNHCLNRTVFSDLTIWNALRSQLIAGVSNTFESSPLRTPMPVVRRHHFLFSFFCSSLRSSRGKNTMTMVIPGIRGVGLCWE